MPALSPRSETSVPNSIMPTITPRTHLVALLGPANAVPQLDGWFAADFCLLNQLFQGLGKSQAWFTSVDFDSVIRDYGPVLHGNPLRPRRVVCQTPAQLNHVHHLSQRELVSGFLGYLSSICRSSKYDEHVLIMLFGHGDDEENFFAFSVGDDQDLHRDQILAAVQTPTTIRPKISLLLTSCFSGGWALDPRFDATIMAGARYNELSDSMPRSASNRFGGGVFTQALVTELLRGDTASLQGTSYKDWCRNIKDEMDRLFGLGAKPEFAARDGTWEQPYDEATGIYRVSYRDRYNALPFVSPNPHPDSISDRVFGARSVFRGRLQALCRRYILLRPGHDNSAGNVHLSSLVHRFYDAINRTTSRPFTDHEAIYLAACLRHRIGLAKLAEVYVEILRLRPFRSFCMFVRHEWEKDASESRQNLFREAYSAISEVGRGIFFPRGPMRRGDLFAKPKDYLAAAFADKGLDRLDVERRMSIIKDNIVTGQPLW